MTEFKRYYLNDRDTEVIKVAICNRLDYLLGEYMEKEDPSLAGLWPDIYTSIVVLAGIGFDNEARYYNDRLNVINAER